MNDDNNLPDIKSNDEPEDYSSLLVKLIRKQLIDKDPEYDGSSLTLNGRNNNGTNLS